MSSTAVSVHLLSMTPADILKGHFCDTVDSITNADRFANELYQADLITLHTKTDLDSVNGNFNKTNKLVTLVQTQLRTDHGDHAQTLRTFCQVLRDLGDSQPTNLANSMLRQLVTNRNTPVAVEVRNCNVVNAAKALNKEFKDLMVFIEKEMQPKDAKELRFRINSYFKDERIVNEMGEIHLSRIEDFVEPSAILNYLYRHEFIGYINYALVKEVQEVVKSRLLDKHMEEYEKDYQSFLQLALKDIHAAFKKCPDLQPNYPVGLPSFTIHLESEWDGRSMYEWKELFERRFSWPETLNIVKISKNCIVITCTVWPKFAEDVVKNLTDPKVIADLKKEGVTIDISPQLLAYHRHGDFPIATGKEAFASADDQQGTVEQSIKGTSSIDADDHSLAEDSTDTIPEVDTLPSLSTVETEQGAKESPLKDQPGEGILLIKPDWDEHVDDASGYVSMKQDSDGQTVTSGDTEGRQQVELQDEHVVRRLLSEKESVEKQLVFERKMKTGIVKELEQIKVTSPSDCDDNNLAEDSIATVPEVDTLLEPTVKDSHLKDRPAQGMLLIKPDWDECNYDPSGCVSMKQDSNGQTVVSGDTEDHQLVKPITLREAIDKCELVVGRLLSEKKSIGQWNQYLLQRQGKMETKTEMSSILRSIEELFEQFKTLQAATEQLKSLQEQVVKLQELSTKQESLIAELTERLCQCEAEQHAEGKKSLELPALRQKIDELLVSVDLGDSKAESTDQIRRHSNRRSTTKRASRPISGIFDSKSSSISSRISSFSATSSGYRSGGSFYQESTEPQSLLTVIKEEEESAYNLATITLTPETTTPTITSSPEFTLQKDVDHPIDLEELGVQ